MIASVTLSLLSVAPISADSGSNDDFASAELIEPGPFSGNLDGSSDLEDYYKFNMTAGDKISISFTCSSNAFDLTIYNEDESWLAGVDGSSSVTNYLSYMTSAETTFTSCYLVAETDSEASSYSIETFTLTHQNDGGQGVDAPASRTGSLIKSEGTITGEVDSGKPDDNYKGEDDMDCYKFWAGMGDRINITFTTTALDYLYLNLLEPDEDYIFQDLKVRGADIAMDEWWTANETAMGWFYIEVYQDGTPGQYTITLVIERQSEADSGEDAPGTSIYALPVISGNINGHLEDDDQYDCFKFDAGNGDVISISFRGFSDGDHLYIDLLGPSDQVLMSNKSSISDSGTFIYYYTANETPVQTFVMKVWRDSMPGNYVITLAISKQNDAGSGIDVPGTSTNTTVLGPGSFEGWIFDLDMADMYKVPLVSGDVLDITLGVSEGSYVSMELLNKTMSSLVVRSTFFGSYARIRYCIDAIVDNITTYLKVFGSSTRYSMGITISGQNDAGLGGDAGGIVEMGTTSTKPYLVGTGTFSGYLHSGDTTDSYSIDVDDNKRLNITVGPEATLMVGIFLHNSTGSPVASELGGLGSTVVLTHEIVKGGSMQFVLGSYGLSGNYTVTVTITDITPVEGTPSSPVLIAVSGSGKVTLTWSAPPSDGGSPITGYKIYRKVSGTSTPATLLTLVGPSVLSHMDTDVVVGTTYEYFVKAYNANGDGTASNSVTASPTQDTTDTDSDGIPDSWEVRYELNPGDSADALLDPDNDGRNNLKEYQDDTDPRVKDSPIADDDDDDDDDDDGFLSFVPLGWVGCCIGFIIIGVILLIIVLIVVLIIAKGRKKKDEKEEDDVPIAAGGDEEASEE